MKCLLSPDAKAEGDACGGGGKGTGALSWQIRRKAPCEALGALHPPPGLRQALSPQGVHFNVNETKKVGKVVFF